MKKIKCTNCNKTLMLAEIIKGEIKCPRCGVVNKVIYIDKGKSQ